MKLILLSMLLCVVCSATQATATIKLITLAGPGSQSDTAARFFAPLLSEELKTPVVVVNYPGGGGLIGTRHFLSLPADGTNILIGNSTLAYNTKTATTDVDIITTIEPVYGLSTSPLLVIVPVDSPVKSLKDFQVLLSRNGRVLGGSALPTISVSMKQLDEQISSNTTIINYRQISDLLLNLTNGMIDYTLQGAGNAAAQGLIDSGKLRVIAVLDGNRRLPMYPLVPTLREQGYKPIENFSWTAYFVKSDTPQIVKAALTKSVATVMNSTNALQFSAKPGSPSRLLATGEQVRAIQYRELIILPSEKSTD